MKNIYMTILISGLMLGAFFAGSKLIDPKGCGAFCPKEFVNMDPVEFKKQSSDNSVKIIDVRRPDEFSEGHIEGAINADIGNSESFNKFLESLDKNQKYLVYCRSGNRSGQAMKIMEEKGFTNVINLSGGILAWQKENFSLVK